MSKIILVRGQEYRQADYDWYIDEALELAPRWWKFDMVIKLRDAIRENYQHSYDIDLTEMKGKAKALRSFINEIDANERMYD